MKIVALSVLVMTCVLAAQPSAVPPPQPVATLDLSQLLPCSQITHPTNLENVAFVSNSVVAVTFCVDWRNCTLVLIRWEGGVLRGFAQTNRSLPNEEIHLTSAGLILTTPSGKSPGMLYSADLSVTADLPPLHYVSQSGNTVAEATEVAWKLYHLDSKLHAIREGTGHLQSISDEAMVIWDGDMIRTETLQGKLLGSFRVRPECFQGARLVGRDRLFLSDCKKTRVVDFDGMEQSKLRPPKGLDYTSWSDDGRRVLFNHFSRKVSVLRNTGEIVAAIVTVGMGVADEMDNRQEVEVADVASGKSCFDLWRRFAENSETISRNAALSPSGESAVVVVGSILSVYSLPAVCENKK